MEVILLFSCALTILGTANVHGAAIGTSPDVLVLDNFTPDEQEYLNYLEQEIIRKKRSEDLLSIVKAKLAQGIKSKLGHIASASSHASHGKKEYKDYHHHHYGPPIEHHEEEEKTFDFWSLQKSILNTLLQAVKAIKGGLIAVKGHLIKGGGYIISAKGKLISAKGEAITNLGKSIASSALLSPPKHHHSEEIVEHHEYGHPPSGYGGPSGPSGSSGPSGHEIDIHSSHHHSSSPLSGYSDHKFPSGFEAYKDHLPRGAHHGILVLKKIPKGHKIKLNGNDGSHYPSESHHIPDSKPHEPSTSSFLLLPDMKGIFSASSLKGHEDKHPAHSSSAHSYPEYSDDEHSHHHYHPHIDHHALHSHHEDSRDHKPIHHLPSSDDHDSAVHYESHANHHEIAHSQYKLHPHDYKHESEVHHVKHTAPPATNYGSPFPLPDNTNYLKDLLNSFQNMQSTGGLSNYQTKLETYEPLQLPNSASIGSGLSSTNSHGLQHYQTFPLELSQNFGAQHKLLGNVPNYHQTGPYY